MRAPEGEVGQKALALPAFHPGQPGLSFHHFRYAQLGIQVPTRCLVLIAMAFLLSRDLQRILLSVQPPGVAVALPCRNRAKLIARVPYRALPSP